MTEAQQAYLLGLYTAYMNGNDFLFWDNWASEFSSDEGMVSVHNALETDGYVSDSHLARTSEITEAGIYFIERSCELDLLLAMKSRHRLLSFLADVGEMFYDINKGFERYIADLELTNNEAIRAMRYLRGIGAVRSDGANYSITSKGFRRLERIRIEARFRELKDGGSVSNQERGHVLEDILATVAESEGFSVGKRVLAPGEENDLVLSKRRETWIVSCKWTAEPSGDPVLRDLETKVGRRGYAFGLLVSMSGFTEHLRSNASHSPEIVLLVDGSEVDRLIRADVSLDDLLQFKWEHLMRHRESI